MDTSRQLYQDLLTKTKQTGLETELKTTNIRIVEKAERPRAPVSPDRMRNYKLALLLGLGIGVGIALGFEHLDNTFKTPDDVKEHLQLPFLGMVPDVEAKGPGAAPAPRGQALSVQTRNPTSPIAEAYRSAEETRGEGDASMHHIIRESPAIRE